MNREQSIGVSVKDTAPDTKMATLRVTANSWNCRPMIPPMNNRGMKTATSEMLIESTVNPICFAPLRVASIGERPCSTYRTMFSMTTIASSTTNPTETVSAINEMLSKLKCSSHIAAKVPANDKGTAVQVMKVVE